MTCPGLTRGGPRDSGTSYKVEVSDAVTAGKVAADAIYIAPTGAPLSDAFTWTPTIPNSGIYQVYARWPASSANTGAAQYTVTHVGGTANAPYTIYHEDGSTTVTVNQQQNDSTWMLLGTFTMAPGQNHRVALADTANGTKYSGSDTFSAIHDECDSVIADAVCVTRVGAPPPTATWTPTLPRRDRYQVYARWEGATAG